MSANPHVELIARLRATKTQHRIDPIFGGSIGAASDETREVLVNPDGPEAANALELEWRILQKARQAADALEAATPSVREKRLEEALRWIADFTKRRRLSTDDWFDLSEIELTARASLSNSPSDGERA